MVRIAISQSAFDAIMASMQLGSVGAENATDEQGQRLIWLEPQVLAGLRALRWPSESYSDVIIRMAAYNAVETSVATAAVEQVEVNPPPAGGFAPSPGREKLCRSINATEAGFQLCIGH